MPVAMFVAVVLTANHYLVDAIVGAVLTATCWVCAGWRSLRSRGTPANPARQIPRQRVPIEVLDAQSVGIDRPLAPAGTRDRAAEHELAR
jgi:hypothetical protein